MEAFAFTVPTFKTKSEIWAYFGFMADSHGAISDKKKIACWLCQTIIAYFGKTSNMTYHLQRAHSSEYEKYLKRTGKESNSDISSSDSSVTSEQASNNASEVKQITLSTAFKRAALLPPNSPRYTSLLCATMNFVFQTLQQLSIVDEPAFCNLLQVAEPKFRLPHRTVITSKVLPEAYSEVQTAVERQLVTAEKCTITTDLWTSQYQQCSYMSLTVHFIDRNFTLQSKCLQTLEVPQDHDTASLKDIISTMLSNWKIKDKFCGGITDNDSNIVSAFGLLKIDHFPCIAHTSQLAVNKGLKVARIQRIIGRCKTIVSHFKRSTKETCKLQEKTRIVETTTTHACSRLCNTLG